MTEPLFLTLDEVLAIHADQIRRYGGRTGLLIEELVEIQGFATQDGTALAWCGPAPIAPPAPTERDPRAYTPKHLAFGAGPTHPPW